MSLATEEFKEQIRELHLRPAILRDVAEFTCMRFHNRKWGERMEMLAKITTVLAMASVSAGLWSTEASRACMLASLLLKASNLTLLAVSSVLKKRSSLSTDQLNRTLHSIGIDTLQHIEPESKNMDASQVQVQMHE